MFKANMAQTMILKSQIKTKISKAPPQRKIKLIFLDSKVVKMYSISMTLVQTRIKTPIEGCSFSVRWCGFIT